MRRTFPGKYEAVVSVKCWLACVLCRRGDLLYREEERGDQQDTYMIGNGVFDKMCKEERMTK